MNVVIWQDIEYNRLAEIYIPIAHFLYQHLDFLHELHMVYSYHE